MMTAAKVKTVAAHPPDPYVANLLEHILEGKRVISVQKSETIFSQGDRADSIYFVETGRVKVSVVSSSGKEGVLAMVGPHGFFGEGSLVGQFFRLASATAMEPATMYQVEKRAMLRALLAQPELSEKFMVSLVERNIDIEEDLCDQLFNDSEKRLARVLLKLAGEHGAEPDVTIHKLSHEILAEMVGTTRSRITHFMNKFRKMELIEYDKDLTVRTERLKDVVLND